MKVENIELFNMGTVNKNKVSIKTVGGRVILYFSYETIVGFEVWDQGNYRKAVRQNDWSTTTGKLLNELEPDKKARVSGEEFGKLVAELFGKEGEE